MSPSDSRSVRIGTRGSALALAQSTIVREALSRHGVESELVTITTAGDRRAPDTEWGEGAFVRAIEAALLEGAVDVAVHSAKDVPTDEHPRLRVGAYLPRDEPADALVLPVGVPGTLDDLAPGTVVGTDSPRRRGFLLARRPDIELRPLHGNVDTRLRRLDTGEVDALVLAAAGLLRLGRADRISELLPAEVLPPAPGQGAIAVQARVDDEATLAVLVAIDDRPTRTSVEAERAFLEATGGGCRAPVGALATVSGDEVEMVAGFATLDGRAAGLEHGTASVEEAGVLARRLADRIADRRARLPGAPRALLTRAADDSRRLAARLSELGVAPVIVPGIDVELLVPNAELEQALAAEPAFDWVVATSRHSALALAGARAAGAKSLRSARWAAVGRSTARALMAAGAPDVWLPSQSDAATLGAELPVEPGQRILRLRGSLADDALDSALRRRRARVTAITVYRTVEAPSTSRAALADALAGPPLGAVFFASPSAVRGILALADSDRERLLPLPAVCIGATTTAAARQAGFSVVVEAPNPEASAVAELVAEYLNGVTA